MRGLYRHVEFSVVIDSMLSAGSDVRKLLDEIEREPPGIQGCPFTQSKALRLPQACRSSDSRITRTNCCRASSDVTRRWPRRICRWLRDSLFSHFGSAVILYQTMLLIDSSHTQCVYTHNWSSRIKRSPGDSNHSPVELNSLFQWATASPRAPADASPGITILICSITLRGLRLTGFSLRIAFVRPFGK